MYIGLNAQISFQLVALDFTLVSESVKLGFALLVARLENLRLSFATMEKFAGFWSQFGSGKGGREIMKMGNVRRGKKCKTM